MLIVRIWTKCLEIIHILRAVIFQNRCYMFNNGNEDSRKNCETTIMVIIFWEFSVFNQIFLSPQVKWSVSISNKQGKYALLHELPNVRKLGNKEIWKSQSSIEFQPSVQSPSQNENFFNANKKLVKNRNCTLPVVSYSTRRLEPASNISPMIAGCCSSVSIPIG